MNEEKIGLWERISYGFGDLGCNIIYCAASTFLMFYYTDYVHMNGAVIGSIILFSRIIDVLVNLLVGVLVDRTKSKYGKCRPWIIYCAIPLAVVAVMMFSVPVGLSKTGQTIYFFITYNLTMSVLYTAINVPYSTLNALMTQDQYERSVLSIFRMILAAVGSLVITNATMPLVKYFGNNLSAWTKTFVLFGVLAVLMFVLNFAGTKERVKVSNDKPEEKLSFTQSVHVLKVNKYWMMITLSMFLLFVSYSLGGGAMVYYAGVILKNENLVGTMNLISSIVQIIVMMFTAILIKRIGKGKTMCIGLIIHAIGFIMFAFPSDNLMMVYLACVVKGIGNAGISSTMFAIVSDTIEYGEWMSGRRTEGLINSATSCGYKIGNGLGIAMVGWILSLGGYAVNPQAAKSVFAIKLMFVYIPAVLLLASAVIMAFFKLDKEYPDIIKKLKKGERYVENKTDL